MVKEEPDGKQEGRTRLALQDGEGLAAFPSANGQERQSQNWLGCGGRGGTRVPGGTLSIANLCGLSDDLPGRRIEWRCRPDRADQRGASAGGEGLLKGGRGQDRSEGAWSTESGP